MEDKKMILIVLGRVDHLLNKRTNYGHICVLCGHFGFAHEVTWDEKFGGYVHWSCKKSWEKQEREEQRFEQIMDEMRRRGDR